MGGRRRPSWSPFHSVPEQRSCRYRFYINFVKDLPVMRSRIRRFILEIIMTHEISCLNSMLESSSNGRKGKEKTRPRWERLSDVILIRSCKDIEGKFIDFLSSLTKKTVIPVGPLMGDEDANTGTETETEMVEWLDKKDKASAVFVSFGSEYFLSRLELEEIGHGLELSKVHFVRKYSPEEAFPESFLTRLGEKGMVIKGWAPQKRILRHCSMRGFRIYMIRICTVEIPILNIVCIVVLENF